MTTPPSSDVQQVATSTLISILTELSGLKPTGKCVMVVVVMMVVVVVMLVMMVVGINVLQPVQCRYGDRHTMVSGTGLLYTGLGFRH